MRKAIVMILIAATFAACNNRPDQQTHLENEGMDKQEATRSSADSLFQKKWVLLELDGKPIVLDTSFQQSANVVFHPENRISGNLGCNGFGGDIEYEAGNKIKITSISATELACPNLGIEKDFLYALNNAKSYVVENNILILRNDSHKATAKLEANIHSN